MLFKILLSLLLFLLFFSGCEKDQVDLIHESPFLWVVGEQTVVKSSNAGTDWYDCVANNQISSTTIVHDKEQVYRSISFLNTLTGCICGDNSFVATTTNAQYWQGQTFGYGTSTLYSSVMLDSNASYFCGDDKTFFKYQNNSMSSPTLPGAGINNNFYGMDFLNYYTGWIVGDNSSVYYKENPTGIQRWTYQNTAPGNIYNAVYIHWIDEESREVWIAGDKGVIYTTSDNGTSWNRVEVETTTSNLTSICFSGKRTGYFAGHDGIILKTTDNGFHFQNLNSGTKENLNSISFMNEDIGVAVGDHGTIIKTTDGGNTWEQLPWYNTKNLYGVCFAKRYVKK